MEKLNAFKAKKREEIREEYERLLAFVNTHFAEYGNENHHLSLAQYKSLIAAAAPQLPSA